MNENEPADEATKSQKSKSEIVLCKGDVMSMADYLNPGNGTGHMLFRCTGGMTLTQALKGNMGDPERSTYRRNLKRAFNKRTRSHERRKRQALRKSDQVIVAMKALKGAGAKGLNQFSEHYLNNSNEEDLR